LAMQQSAPALQLAASDGHLVVSTPVLFLEPGGHVAELQVALAVQQLVSNALDGAAAAFFGSLYLSRRHIVAIPKHCVTSTVQQTPTSNIIVHALQLAASDRHLVSSTPVLFLEPAGHVAELQVAFGVQQLVSNALDGAAAAFFGSLYLSRGHIVAIPKHCVTSTVQQSPTSNRIVHALQLAASDGHLVVSTPVLFLEPAGHVAELQVALGVQQLV